jgi:hypothetical protein
MKTKITRIQRRVHEIGLVGRIAHNLAKYSINVEGAYNVSEFLLEVRAYMVERGVPTAQIHEWIKLAEHQAAQEISFFLMNGRFAESTGGTSIAVCALIGPILDELGYEGQ